MGVWEHPPHYRADLSPSDFYVLGPMKNELAKIRHHSDDEAKEVTRDWCSKTGRELFQLGISKLVQTYEICRKLFGNYVGNLVNISDVKNPYF